MTKLHPRRFAACALFGAAALEFLSYGMTVEASPLPQLARQGLQKRQDGSASTITAALSSSPPISATVGLMPTVTAAATRAEGTSADGSLGNSLTIPTTKAASGPSAFAQVTPYTTTRPVLATWSSGSSTWTATQDWTTAVVTPTPSPTLSASTTQSSVDRSKSPAIATSTPRLDHSLTNAENIARASSSAVAAVQAFQQWSTTTPSPAGSPATNSTSPRNDGGIGGDGPVWLSPAPGQIFAGGQSVTLSW